MSANLRATSQKFINCVKSVQIATSATLVNFVKKYILFLEVQSMENHMGCEAFDDFDFGENANTQNFELPMLEPGNMMGYAHFEDYYTAMVVMPQIREKEEQIRNLLREIREFHTKQILACSDLSDVESFHNFLFERIKSSFIEVKISERGLEAGRKLFGNNRG
jgi:hypothetical protein